MTKCRIRIPGKNYYKADGKQKTRMSVSRRMYEKTGRNVSIAAGTEIVWRESGAAESKLRNGKENMSVFGK